MADQNTSNTQPNRAQIRVEPITNPEDFNRFFELAALTFGHQVHDGVWCAMNPSWDTPEGCASGSARLSARWSTITRDRHGNPNTIFLKAVLGDGSGDEGKIVGAAIWEQASMVDGYGQAPAINMDSTQLEALYPNQPDEQRYLRQVDHSLRRRRLEVVREIATSSSPAVMVLDLCVVDPACQRLGIATRLVEWGLREAKARGGLEAVLEASSMGRHVYRKLGFEQEGGEFLYDVDEEFRHREQPSNVFMRTGRPVA
ncbi:acyl-CoA N-acyltransferase [Aspergillus pseudotamarii]|uniref:Acyl-CoA N-acyltransferase n=1 Tax=Aspergillus pseudotamarii TaxID=132259 RepID=A0A5N6SWU7_ASPPS|nr:acyl-CoA N-acyltransferase [Aspergillus pseudotamarii]KAE8138377.1 acyl-CoA N-acyltransferase [Aspergillus pseudotamarii]